MTTRKEQLEAALRPGDTLDTLTIIYQPIEGPCECWQEHTCPEPSPCSVDDLTRDFHGGYGGANGEPILAYSDRYVYFGHAYDGFDSIASVPRSPEHVGRTIPIIGE